MNLVFIWPNTRLTTLQLKCGFRANTVIQRNNHLSTKQTSCDQYEFLSYYFICKRQDCKSYSKFLIQISDTLLQAQCSKPGRNLPGSSPERQGRGETWASPDDLDPGMGSKPQGWSGLTTRPQSCRNTVEKERETGEFWVWKDILRCWLHSCVKNVSTQDNKIALWWIKIELFWSFHSFLHPSFPLRFHVSAYTRFLMDKLKQARRLTPALRPWPLLWVKGRTNQTG